MLRRGVSDKYKFRTSPLRNVAIKHPTSTTEKVDTLEQAVELMGFAKNKQGPYFCGKKKKLSFF
jgi:cytochrome c peroxidase